MHHVSIGIRMWSCVSAIEQSIVQVPGNDIFFIYFVQQFFGTMRHETHDIFQRNVLHITIIQKCLNIKSSNLQPHISCYYCLNWATIKYNSSYRRPYGNGYSGIPTHPSRSSYVGAGVTIRNPTHRTLRVFCDGVPLQLPVWPFVLWHTYNGLTNNNGGVLWLWRQNVGISGVGERGCPDSTKLWGILLGCTGFLKEI